MQIRIEEAAQRFGVSLMTIRRDLAELEASGRVRRIRGGAEAAPTPKPFVERTMLNVAAKREIARKAARVLPARGTVALDASSTVGLAATELGVREDLSIMTNSIELYARLVGMQGIRPLLSGGAPEPTTGSLTGPLAVRASRALFYDVALISADALDAGDGTSEVSLAEAEVKRSFAEQAARCVVCVDSTKLGRRSVAAAIDMDYVTTLITELDPADRRLVGFRGMAEIL